MLRRYTSLPFRYTIMPSLYQIPNCTSGYLDGVRHLYHRTQVERVLLPVAVLQLGSHVRPVAVVVVHRVPLLVHLLVRHNLPGSAGARGGSHREEAVLLLNVTRRGVVIHRELLDQVVRAVVHVQVRTRVPAITPRIRQHHLVVAHRSANRVRVLDASSHSTGSEAVDQLARGRAALVHLVAHLIGVVRAQDHHLQRGGLAVLSALSEVHRQQRRGVARHHRRQ